MELSSGYPTIQALVHAARMEHEQGTPNTQAYGTQSIPTAPATASAKATDANPCPYPNCQAMLTDPHVTQEQFRTFHGQPNNLAMMPESTL